MPETRTGADAGPRHRRPRHAFRVLLRPLTVVAILAGAAACAVESEPSGADRAAVDAALDSTYAVFSEAYARANVQLLMDEVYAPDAFYLPPDSPILQGQDQFRGQFSFLERYARADAPGPRISFEITDRQISDDLVTDIGVYTLRAPDAPADAPGTRGKFIVVWRRIRGEWRIWADGYSAVESPPAGVGGD